MLKKEIRKSADSNVAGKDIFLPIKSVNETVNPDFLR